MSTPAAASSSVEPAGAKTDATAPIIVDLGKHPRKRIRNLRRGTGRLVDEVNGCIEELRATGTLSPAAQTVVVIVRQRKRKSKSLKSLFPGM